MPLLICITRAMSAIVIMICTSACAQAQLNVPNNPIPAQPQVTPPPQEKEPASPPAGKSVPPLQQSQAMKPPALVFIGESGKNFSCVKVDEACLKAFTLLAKEEMENEKKARQAEAEAVAAFLKLSRLRQTQMYTPPTF